MTEPTEEDMWGTFDEEPQDKKECLLCNTIWGAFGIIIGLAFLFVGTDILTGGKLSNMISGKGDNDGGSES